MSRNSVARKDDLTGTIWHRLNLLIILPRITICATISYILTCFIIPGERSFAYSTAPIEKKNRCPIAFHDIGGRCYFYGYFKLNWFRAIEFCHSFGESVSLACIESKDENEQLKKWLLRNGKI